MPVSSVAARVGFGPEDRTPRRSRQLLAAATNVGRWRQQKPRNIKTARVSFSLRQIRLDAGRSSQRFPSGFPLFPTLIFSNNPHPENDLPDPAPPPLCEPLDEPKVPR